MRAGVMVELVWQYAAHLNLPGKGLLLCSQVLLLAGHEVLLFLLPSLESILLLSSEGSPEAREAVREGRLSAWGSSSTWASTRPSIAWLSCSWAMRNADLRNQEGLAGVADAAN
jgi:hypothetical protein